MKPRVERHSFKGLEFYLLRDDLLGEFNGNKARKLEYFLKSDLSEYDSVVSYGSSQSNAMYSLSLFAKKKGLEFKYVISHLSSNLRENPIGNFKFALLNGMKYFIKDDKEVYAKSLCDEKTIFIKEGVANKEAEFGFKNQAEFIDEFALKNRLNFDIFLPSGTGTSACYLAKHSKFNVFTCPCVGDSNYLKKQISELSDKISNLFILNPPKKYHFAKPKMELFNIYNELKDECKVEFDLIYDTVGFLTILSNLGIFKNDILYIHQGGILGNISQKLRYEYKIRKKDENFK